MRPPERQRNIAPIGLAPFHGRRRSLEVHGGILRDSREPDRHRQRVVVELEDDDGREVRSSAPCAVGRLTLEASTWGLYRGRIYTWVLDRPIRSIAPVQLVVDAPVVYWQLTTPP